MNDLTGQTAYLATVLTETQAGFKWSLEFFHAVHYAQWKGEYEENEGWFRATFEELVTKSFGPGPTSASISTVRWAQLYEYCLEKTKSPDHFATHATERVAGLITTVPDFWRPVIDLFAKHLSAGSMPLENRDAIIPEFRGLVTTFMATPGVKNLDIEGVVWSELYAYAWRRAEHYARALAAPTDPNP